MKKEKYGFFTAVTMITGIVIGSGIFFKSDNILEYTNGNVTLGILVFVIAAFAIIFGSLTISQLARRTDKPGGLITYVEEFVGTNFSKAFGWFQMLLYMPTLSAVIPWVVGIYICQLFGINGSNLIYTLIGLAVIIVLYVTNILSSRLGGYFQNAATVIKLIPLLTIAIFGLIFGHPAKTFSTDIGTIRQSIASTGWYAAFAPIAFSFDGWVVSTSICHEIKNSKKSLPLALIISPLLILGLKLSPKLGGMPFNSAILSFAVTMVWLLIHFITQEYGIPGDVSEISIAFSYILYIVVYIAVIRLLVKEKSEGIIMRYIVPILAICGSLIIFCGSVPNPMFGASCIICGIVVILGFFYKKESFAKRTYNGL